MGSAKEVCLAYLPDIGVGDYAIVHAGFAISQVDEVSAQETLELLREIEIRSEERGNSGRPKS